MQYSNNATLVALIAVGSVVNTVAMTAATADDLQVMVEADWTAQERRLGRTPDSPEAIRDVLKRAERLRDDLRQMRNPPDLRAEVDALARLQQKVTRVKSLDVPTRLALYHEVRSAARNMALKNPLLTSRQVVFLKRRRFVFQMLHEFVGYYYNYVGTAGGCVCVLEDPGRSLAVRDLTGDCLPRGNYATLALSFDARTAYFAFAEVADRSDARQVGDWTLLKPAASVPAELNYYSPERCTFHIFAMDTDGGNLRQLTHGPDDDFDHCPVPNGEIAFRRHGEVGFAVAAAITSPFPLTRCTAWMRRVTVYGRFRFTKPTSGTRRCWPTGGLSIRDGITLIVPRPTFTACGSAIRTAATRRFSSATTPSKSAPAFSPGRSPVQTRSCSWPGLIIPRSAVRWWC